MQNEFNTLIDSYLDDKVGISNYFLEPVLALQLKHALLSLNATQQMKSAGTGNEVVILQDKLIRSDKIYWLDRSHDNPEEKAFFVQMDAFVAFLNETCYTGITSYEFHYACYEVGTFYKKHLDQFRNDNRRAFSMILYLNENWQEGDGGELCIYQDGLAQMIAPLFGKSVFFKSNELEHEVLETHKQRLSITGWLKTS